MTTTIRRTSHISVPPERAWQHATSMPAINRELWPWMKMTYPVELERLTLDDPRARIGEPLFASWILLFGFLPVERLTVTLVELERGRRFVEQSGTRAMRFWRHERTIEPAPGGCTVTDEVSVEAPLRAATPLVGRALSLLFAHRHRRLAALLS